MHVSTEGIVLVWFIKYMVTVTIKKGVYVQVIRSTARQYFRGRQHGPHENVNIRKTNLLKTLEIAEI